MASTLDPNQVLGPNQEIWSNNQRTFLIMQGDGNLVLNEFWQGRPYAVWASNTNGNDGAWAIMQGDGNLVINSRDNQYLWHTGTWGNPGAFLLIQDDGNAVVYTTDATPLWVSNTIREGRTLDFDPKKNGFHFPNDFTNNVANIPGHGDVQTQGRCGGMAYASLDYYYANVPIPAYEGSIFAPLHVPPDGHWLADYLYERLMDSFCNFSAIRFIQWTLTSDHETWANKGVIRWTKEDEFPKLRDQINSGSPAVLGLVNAGKLEEIGNENHQVVAYGYEFHPVAGTMTVFIYDNNYPKEVVTLNSEPGNPHFNASTSNGKIWRGFFVHDYERRDPPFAVRPPPGVISAFLAPSEAVRYDDDIKLSHLWTGMTLHSHPLNYGHPGSSGQQQVTAFEGYDANDCWLVKGPDGQPDYYKAGECVRNGDVIRLMHVQTGRNLHSHSGHPSPVTGQQEVTCFGDNGVGDFNDNWRVELDDNRWYAGSRLRLIHVATDCALHSHPHQSDPQWTAGQQEVTAYPYRDDNDWWLLLEFDAHTFPPPPCC